MKWLARIFGFLLLVIVLLLVIGFVLPAHHKITGTRTESPGNLST